MWTADVPLDRARSSVSSAQPGVPIIQYGAVPASTSRQSSAGPDETMAGRQLSFDIYSYRAGGTDRATVDAVLAYVLPLVKGDRVEVFDPELGEVATAVAGDPAEWGEQEHLVITYNRPTPSRSLALLEVIHRVATVGEQTLCVPMGYPAVTVEAARAHAAPQEVDAPLLSTADALLDYWVTNGAI